MVLFNPLTDGRFLTVITTYYHRFRGQPFKAETISLSNGKNGVDCYSCDRSLHGKVKTEQQWDCANEKKKTKTIYPYKGPNDSFMMRPPPAPSDVRTMMR